MNASDAHKALRYDPATGLLFSREPRGSLPAGAGAGSLNKRNGYVYVAVNYTRYLAHRVIWLMHNNAWPAHQIDHINGLRNDNRIENLREATIKQQRGNVRGYSKRGLPKGVTTDKNRFVARANVNGKSKHLGSFLTPEEAHAAYCEFSKERFGEFFCSGARS